MKKTIGIVVLVFLCMQGFCQKKVTEPEKKDSTAHGLTLVLNEEQANSLSILLQVGRAYMPETDISMKAGIRVMSFGDSLTKYINARIAQWRSNPPANKAQGN